MNSLVSTVRTGWPWQHPLTTEQEILKTPLPWRCRCQGWFPTCYCQGKGLAFLLSPNSMVPALPPFADVGNRWVRQAAQRRQLWGWSGSPCLLHHGISTITPYSQLPIQLYSIPRKSSIHYSKPQAGLSLPPHCP